MASSRVSTRSVADSRMVTSMNLLSKFADPSKEAPETAADVMSKLVDGSFLVAVSRKLAVRMGHQVPEDLVPVGGRTSSEAQSNLEA